MSPTSGASYHHCGEHKNVVAGLVAHASRAHALNGRLELLAVSWAAGEREKDVQCMSLQDAAQHWLLKVLLAAV